MNLFEKVVSTSWNHFLPFHYFLTHTPKAIIAFVNIDGLHVVKVNGQYGSDTLSLLDSWEYNLLFILSFPTGNLLIFLNLNH